MTVINSVTHSGTPSSPLSIASTSTSISIVAPPSTNAVTEAGIPKKKQKKDAMQAGADFISFDDLDPVSRATSSGESDEEDQEDEKLKSSSKRKRDREDDMSDQENKTAGPPPGAPWMGTRRYSNLRSIPEMLTAELTDFVKYVGPSRIEHKVRQYAFRRIEEAVKELWPMAKVLLFGSFETMLYLPTSDLDIVVLYEGIDMKNDLHALATALRRKNVGSQITVLTKTRVPLVKFHESLSDIPVDISFNLLNGIQSAEMVKEFVRIAPVLRPMTLIVKFFLMIKGQNEVFTGGIGSYTTMIMILSFLQMHPFIQTSQIIPDENLGVLLVEFFELYGSCFNYDSVGISVVNGGSYFPKSRDFNGSGYGRGGYRHEQLLVCTLDPNDLENDTGKGSYNLRAIRENFVGAFGTLTRAMQDRYEELFGRHGLISNRRHRRFSGEAEDGEYYDSRHTSKKTKSGEAKKKYGIEEVSLIKDILPIPYKVFDHRQHVETVFYSGKFQELFNDPPGLKGLDQMEEEEAWAAEQEMKAIELEKKLEEEQRLLPPRQQPKSGVSSKAVANLTQSTNTIVISDPEDE